MVVSGPRPRFLMMTILRFLELWTRRGGGAAEGVLLRPLPLDLLRAPFLPLDLREANLLHLALCAGMRIIEYPQASRNTHSYPAPQDVVRAGPIGPGLSGWFWPYRIGAEPGLCKILYANFAEHPFHALG